MPTASVQQYIRRMDSPLCIDRLGRRLCCSEESSWTRSRPDRNTRPSGWSPWRSVSARHTLKPRKDLPDEKTPVRIHDADPSSKHGILDIIEDSWVFDETLDLDLIQLEAFSLLGRGSAR